MLNNDTVAALGVFHGFASRFEKHTFRNAIPHARNSTGSGRNNINSGPLRLHRWQPEISAVMGVIAQRAAAVILC